MNKEEAIKYLETLPDDEPVFVLRSKDKYAPSTITVWAASCVASYDSNKKPAEKTKQKGIKALELVREMKEWQDKNGCKLPD